MVLQEVQVEVQEMMHQQVQEVQVTLQAHLQVNEILVVIIKLRLTMVAVEEEVLVQQVVMVQQL